MEWFLFWWIGGMVVNALVIVPYMHGKANGDNDSWGAMFMLTVLSVSIWPFVSIAYFYGKGKNAR